MQISSAGGYNYAQNYSAPNNQRAAQTDKAFSAMVEGPGDDPAEMLARITSNGMQSMWAWQLDQLKSQVAKEVMGEMGLTPEKIAAMPAEQRAEVEDKIMREVEERVRRMIEEEMKKKRANEMGLDPSNPSAQLDIGSLLSMTV